jgi:hypothetical protein
MRLCVTPRRRAPAALDHQVDAKHAPIRQPGGDIIVGNGAVADVEGGFVGTNGLGPAAVIGIDREERGQRWKVLDI